MLSIILQFFIVSSLFTSCEDSGPGFQGTKVEKETNSSLAPGDSQTSTETEASPPEMISGSYLWCEWIDEGAGRGGCAIRDLSNRKLVIEDMTIQWWRIRFRDGGAEVPTQFALQPQESQYHVIFQFLQTVPGSDLAGIELSALNPDGTYYHLPLDNAGEFQNAGVVGTSGTVQFTPLRDLSITPEKAAGLAEPDRSFYFWPNPLDSSEERGENASIVTRSGTQSVPALFLTFDPNGYCAAGGTVRSSLEAGWEANIQAVTSGFSNLVVRKEIVKSTVKIFLPAYDECIVPLNSGTGDPVARTADGGCMFMVIRKRLAPDGFTSPQPYLAIFSKKFSDAVGFTYDDLLAAAGHFGCP